MYKAKDIAKVFEEIAPVETGISGDELGFVYGNPETQVTGLACVWNIHVQSLQSCVEQNANMALSIADYGYVLQTGKIVLEDTAENLLNNKMMREAYLGEM